MGHERVADGCKQLACVLLCSTSAWPLMQPAVAQRVAFQKAQARTSAGQNLRRPEPPQARTSRPDTDLIVEGWRLLKMLQSTAPPASQCWKLRSCAQLMWGPPCGGDNQAAG